MTLILASASPRRARLLEEAGIDFLVRVADVDEHEPATGDPAAVARLNAERKARAVEGELVLGADTVVALGDTLLGKPADAADARRMLDLLSGTTHAVTTGVALRRGDAVEVRAVETRVTMRAWTEDEMRAYVDSGEGLGKAGGYAIQETADRFVTALDGPWDNVVGLPVETVRELLRALA
ncbi:MAG: Maf family protein [Planctomycetota bacterium]